MKKFVVSKAKVNANGDVIPSDLIGASFSQAQIVGKAFNANCDTVISLST